MELFNDFQARVALAPGIMVQYAYNDTSLSQAERAYLLQLQNFAEEQNLMQDLRTHVRGITIGFTVFATVIVGLRFVARKLQAARILIDDYLMVFSLVLLYANMVMNLIREFSTPRVEYEYSFMLTRWQWSTTA